MVTRSGSAFVPFAHDLGRAQPGGIDVALGCDRRILANEVDEALVLLPAAAGNRNHFGVISAPAGVEYADPYPFAAHGPLPPRTRFSSGSVAAKTMVMMIAEATQ